MIDLSFTQDPEWIEQRKRQWKPIGKDLRTDLDAKTVCDVEHYFITGEFRENGRISDGACFTWFPLQTSAAWDYVLQHIVRKADVFEKEFYATLHSQEGRALTEAEELAQWDYFHPKTYTEKITSRVPIGQSGERVEIIVNPHRIASLVLMGFSSYLKYDAHGDWPKWCKRINYFFSIIPYLSYDKEKKYKKREWPYRLYKKVYYMFEFIVKDCRSNRNFTDQHRLRFVDILEEYLETANNLPEKMIEEWTAAKERNNYTSKFTR